MRLCKSWMAVLLVLGLWAGSVQAVTLSRLYDEQLPVEEQSAQSLKSAARTALERVLIRVSGQRGVGDSPVIGEALSRAESLLTQYRYYSQTDAEGGEQLMLGLNFSANQVNGLLERAGLPIWSASRPPVLVWLVADTAEGRRFVNDDNQGSMLVALKSEAIRRGVALQFPMMDLTDAAGINVQDIWQMNLNVVRAASSRYGSAYVLLGRASELSSGQWVANWTLLQADQEIRLDSEGLDSAEAVAPVIDRIADTQARNFSVVVGGDSHSTLIYVDGVSDFVAYAGLLTYLENLSVVEHANPVWVSDSSLVLGLVLNGDMEKVQRFLSLDRQLDTLPEVPTLEAAVTGMNIHNYYRWQGRP